MKIWIRRWTGSYLKISTGCIRPKVPGESPSPGFLVASEYPTSIYSVTRKWRDTAAFRVGHIDRVLQTHHSVAHTKGSLMGSTIPIPITDGYLNLGPCQGWLSFRSFVSKPATATSEFTVHCTDKRDQIAFPGICLMEFRDTPNSRQIVATIT